jgi:hypothetical protein
LRSTAFINFVIGALLAAEAQAQCITATKDERWMVLAGAPLLTWRARSTSSRRRGHFSKRKVHLNFGVLDEHAVSE